MKKIKGHSKDLCGFVVERFLPAVKQRAIGPFVFLDRMGPSTIPAGSGIDVRPHPHIGLSTLTYLFEGAIIHRDSLGNALEITPYPLYQAEQLRLDSEHLSTNFMYTSDSADGLQITGTAGCRCVLIAGPAFPAPRFMWWNFVSSRKERIEQAKQDWSAQRMGVVPGETEFIPLPTTPPRT